MLENRFSVAPTSAAAAAAIAGLQEQSEVYNQKVRALLPNSCLLWTQSRNPQPRPSCANSNALMHYGHAPCQ